MKALALMALLLGLTGCVFSPVQVEVGGGNEFTYSGNSNGEYTGNIIRECAEAVASAIAKQPELKSRGDEAFKNCIEDNGVQAL